MKETNVTRKWKQITTDKSDKGTQKNKRHCVCVRVFIKSKNTYTASGRERKSENKERERMGALCVVQFVTLV